MISSGRVCLRTQAATLHRQVTRQPANLRRCHELGCRKFSQPSVLASQSSQKPSKHVIFSGIQPTGIPHLGNYLGALSNWVKLQESAEPDDVLLFSIVGWHALTLPQDPVSLRSARDDMLAVILATGIDPTRSILFHQDHNLHHTELCWILNCLTPMGKLRRMTTWKSRLAASRNANSEADVDESLLNAGLFTYPVLQAADVLVYRWAISDAAQTRHSSNNGSRATHVPVGEDQRQHIELIRDLADIFNRTFKNHGKPPVFPLPVYVDTPSKRILSLKDPSSKMSKSSPDTASRILLTDTASQIKSKIRAAVTDSMQGITYDPVSRPGTSNLLTILAACTDNNVTEVAKLYANKGHGHLKSDVADAVEELLKAPRAEFEKIRHEKAFLEDVARKGASKAMQYSGATMDEIASTDSTPINDPVMQQESESLPATRSNSGTSNGKIPQALSRAQERKAVEFIEYSFLDIESSFKKRIALSSEPSLTKLPTLSTYLEAMQHLLAFVLQIPPIDPSGPLRTTFLLRLTGDVMNSVPGYPPDIYDLQKLLDFLDDLDQAWVTVLKSQVWDPSSGAGVDIVVPVEMIEPGKPIRSTPVSQTERTRLRSLLVTGTEGLEEWLSGLGTPGEDYQLALARAGLMQGFDDLFAVTLAEMGDFSEPLIGPAGMKGTC
ncbi:Nucleotidylyl transferase [Paxillus ammoniavirescens]|nr:Nucleotidylyl transferase [Paxillus ammoniavirescens]